MIITLCGSARNERLTLAGHAVFGLAVYPSDKGGNKDWYTPDIKEKLDKAHKLKIDASDAILVINYNGYIGDSTKSEIAHALVTGKPIFVTDRYHNTIAINKQKISLDWVCYYKGCPDPMSMKPPCALCYE